MRQSPAGKTSIAGCALAVGALIAGCSEAPPVHRGPIVLITIDALRADLVGTGLMPHLDRLAEDADWAGTAITSSSWTVPSMASLFVGRQPWRHGGWHGARAALRDDLPTLPEILRDLGFRNAAFRSNPWLTRDYGYVRGFERFGPVSRMERVTEVLRGLDGGPQFVWMHVLPPHAPYRLHAPYLDRLTAPRDDLPARITPLEMRRFADPAIPLDPDQRERAWQLYQLNAAHADALVGAMLEALRESGTSDDALIAVTSDHGEEFGENGQVLHGNSLHRVLIEVPLIVKLPARWSRPLDPGPVVANYRLFSTLIEAAGGSPPPGSPPSLFTASHAGALSELYLGNGVNQVSLVEGGRQLVWESRFAPAEERYYDAMLALADGEPSMPLAEEPEEIVARLERRFEAAPPLMGAPGGRPRLEAFEWSVDGTVQPVSAGDDFTRRLQSRWQAANGVDRPTPLAERGEPEIAPEELERLKALGYVVTSRKRQADGD
ncbi:MAG: sulfatase [Acidobacteria bacterium]|nr:sulfatase [Acidobacteriota bacterium]